MSDQEFLDTLWCHYDQHGRHNLPWRQPLADGSFDPYQVMVSEIMLQQTQVSRVIPKFEVFLERFPSVQTLAAAELGDVLLLWSGLGYNRRAKFLWQAAQAVVARGPFPADRAGLVALPGVGINTAGAILAYAYDLPVLFVETNIRSVYIHHFFVADEQVTDKQILERLDATLDREHPRQFYWALMDYGSWLKRGAARGTVQLSAHYTRQSAFAGSRRQVRGQVLRALADDALTLEQLSRAISDERLPAVLADLCGEGLIRLRDHHYSL